MKLSAQLLKRVLIVLSIVLLAYTAIWIVIINNVANNAVPLSQLIFFAAILFVTSLIFAALLWLTLQANIMAAFEKLITGAKNFSNGDWKYHIDVEDKGEIAGVANTLNTMASEIQKGYDMVEANKQEVKIEKQNTQHFLDQEKEKLAYTSFAEKEKLTVILSTLTDGVIVLNKDRNVVIVNKQAEEFVGKKAEEITGKPVNTLFQLHDQDREMTWDEYAPLQDTNAGGVFTKEKVRMESPSITPRLVKLIVLKTKSHNPELGYIMVLHSITEELKTEKTEMETVAAVAKELQAPLKLIKECFAAFSQNPPPPADQQGMYAQGVQMGIDQLTFILENLMTASQLDQGKFNLTPTALDVVPLLQQVVKEINLQAKGRQVSIWFEPPKDPVGQIKADQNSLLEVLRNLLVNAVNFTPVGGTVTVTLKGSDKEVIVQVQDAGVGIPKEEVSNLFRKFYRVPNKQTEAQNGPGLGLYICKSLLEMQQGKIWVDTVENKGSVFSFSLPKS